MSAIAFLDAGTCLSASDPQSSRAQTLDQRAFINTFFSHPPDF